MAASENFTTPHPGTELQPFRSQPTFMLFTNNYYCEHTTIKLVRFSKNGVAEKFLLDCPKGKRWLGKPRYKCPYNIKMYLNVIRVRV
jgi:hypothetical protein